MAKSLRETRFMVGIALHSQGEVRVFNYLVVGRFMRLSDDESEELARRLEHEGLITRLPKGEAVLTSNGAAEATQIVTDSHGGEDQWSAMRAR